jgi:opacity protein-like surface antigen
MRYAILGLLGSVLPGIVLAGYEGWSTRPYLGLSQMGDISGDTQAIGTANGKADIGLSGGFTSGLGVAYRYNDRISAEFAWEYRTNDSEVTLADGTRYKDGNYASNIFFVNGFHHLTKVAGWEPYVGGGLSWIQEIDIDLETAGTELSYSGSGDIGWQVFAGAAREISEQWSVSGEVRYGSITGIDLDQEGGSGAGSIGKLDYQPITAQVAAIYHF